MKKYYYRLISWLRPERSERYSIDGVHFETLANGSIEVSVSIKGIRYRINELKSLEGTSECITDYGIYLAIKNKNYAKI